METPATPHVSGAAAGPPSDSHGLTAHHHERLGGAWHKTLAKGLRARKSFDEARTEAKRFCYESHDFLYDGVYAEKDFRSTVPKVWEMVNIFGPLVSYKNPHRNIRIRWEAPDDPRAQFAELLKRIVNYTTEELGFKTECRMWTDDSILSGMGVMWLEKDPFTKLWGHFYTDVDNFIVDPDAKMLKDAYWCARRRVLPIWEFAELVDVPEDHKDLPNTGVPTSSEDELIDGEPSPKDGALETMTQSETGKTNETIEVWEVYSKMGVGFRLKDYRTSGGDSSQATPKEPLDDYAHFYFVPGTKRIWGLDDWPLPLYLDNDWPFELLWYRRRPGEFWPTSAIKPILGQQRALDWFVTMFLQKLKTTSREFVAIVKDMDEDLVDKIKNGVDFDILDIDPADLGDRRVQDMVQWLQHPEMNPDLYRVYDLLQQLFERSSGLYANIYAETGGSQSRSATDATLRSSKTDLRPDDMRGRVEDAHTRMARRECIAARLDYDAELVNEIIPGAGEAWPEYKEGDLIRIMREYDYTVGIGSTQRPNIEKEQQDALEVFDRMAQVAVQMGDVNAMNQLARNLYRSRNMLEADMVFIQPPQPSEEEQKAQQEAQELEARKAEAGAAQAEEKVDLEKAKQVTESLKQEGEQIAQDIAERKAAVEMIVDLSKAENAETANTPS